MINKISVVINTLNEEKNIERAIKSVKWADEVIVCDMLSDDKTASIAKKLGAKVITHKRTGYVEPARNYAISKTKNDWVLVLDADEEVSHLLALKLQNIADEEVYNVVSIPRKNIIFGKWIQGSMWWPDYNIRFFQKGYVVWHDDIHSKPKIEGNLLKLEENENLALTHYHYQNLTQYLERMIRYTQIQAQELHDQGYKFSWKDLIQRSADEFLSRFFANRGFADGLHGLALAMLQSFSHVVMYLKVWELENFKEQEISLKELSNITSRKNKEFDYWFKTSRLSGNAVRRIFQKAKNKFI